MKADVEHPSVGFDKGPISRERILDGLMKCALVAPFDEGRHGRPEVVTIRDKRVGPNSGLGAPERTCRAAVELVVKPPAAHPVHEGGELGKLAGLANLGKHRLGVVERRDLKGFSVFWDYPSKGLRSVEQCARLRTFGAEVDVLFLDLRIEDEWVVRSNLLQAGVQLVGEVAPMCREGHAHRFLLSFTCPQGRGHATLGEKRLRKATYRCGLQQLQCSIQVRLS